MINLKEKSRRSKPLGSSSQLLVRPRKRDKRTRGQPFAKEGKTLRRENKAL